MARQGKPWFRTSKNTWYITLNGRKLSLGIQGEANEKEATTAWHRLMGGLPLETPQTPQQKPKKAEADQKPDVKLASVRDVITAFPGGCCRKDDAGVSAELPHLSSSLR